MAGTQQFKTEELDANTIDDELIQVRVTIVGVANMVAHGKWSDAYQLLARAATQVGELLGYFEDSRL